VFATGGDGFAVAFARAGGAVRTATALQDSIAAQLWPAATPIRVRTALHALGVGAAERGEPVLACKLVGCANTHLATHRIANNIQGWLEARFDTLLADVNPVERIRATERGGALDRRGLMHLLRRAEEFRASSSTSSSEPVGLGRQ
jgi:hypothetical protein